ncbi:hypothetical protein BHE90_009036 [Fusarium euwallaceae]|uniref:Uncharacterized protein n=1 Tax=Fusarium euwallaceae TaxID=1147111 RepID=A0A430LL79_9HYPO|nr:hypothetical protein BHE90_009036 [Fusarium euwallaceae]
MTRLSSAVTVGVWTDYSQHGKTLTLSNRDAVALLAFLATLVSIVGVRSWRITRFILFMICFPKSPSQTNPNDQTYDTTGNHTGDKMVPTQTLPYQVILRNSETPNGAALSLLSCLFSKPSIDPARKNQHRLRSTLLGTVALSHGIIFIALSILTSQIVLGGTVVSKATSTCGHWTVLANNESDRYLASSEWILNATLDTDNYVQNCYFGSQGTGIFDCEMLQSQSIPFSVFHNATCPFESLVCRTDSAFAMETHNITLAQLGINTKLADQLYFRKRTTCAPIREELFYVKTYTNNDLHWLKEGDNRTLYEFYFGSPDFPNGTLQHVVLNDRLGPSYDLTAYYIPLNATNTTSQNHSLRLSDPLPRGYHGPSIVLLEGGGVTFHEKSNDPLWSVHTKVKYGNGTLAGINLDEAPVMYRMDSDLNVIGCDERIQICHRSTNRCLPWSGLMPQFKATELDDRAAVDADTVFDIHVPLLIVTPLLGKTSIPDSIAGRGGSSLRASRTLHNGRQLRLEPEQWKTELTYWFGLGMARLQLDIYKTIEKHDGRSIEGAMNMWADLGSGSVQDMLCGKIKFRSPNHTSLSFTGVIVVVAVSSVLITLSFFEVFVDLIPAKWRGDRVLVWASSENLALLEGKQRVESEALARGETKA